VSAGEGFDDCAGLYSVLQADQAGSGDRWSQPDAYCLPAYICRTKSSAVHHQRPTVLTLGRGVAGAVVGEAGLLSLEQGFDPLPAPARLDDDDDDDDDDKGRASLAAEEQSLPLAEAWLVPW
jgi:hypothetical protein